MSDRMPPVLYSTTIDYRGPDNPLAPAKDGDAGCDLYAAYFNHHTWPGVCHPDGAIYMPPGERILFKTGLHLAIPEGYYGAVAPRSGLALKHGITITNSPGTVDAGYRGDVSVMLHNLGTNRFAVRPGDRIAQIIFLRFERPEAVRVDVLPESVRGATGFGSTGV